jgi:ribosomal protein L11 methyltransferase
MEKLNFYIDNTAFDIYAEEGVFGDGSHDSTRLMLRALSDIDLQNKNIADVGTGSGILSVFAGLRGGNKIVAIDVDERAVTLANKNFELNNLSNAIAIKNNFLSGIVESQDIILANLGPTEQIRNLNMVKEYLKEDGLLVISWYNVLPLSHFIKDAEYTILNHFAGGDYYDVYVLKVK